MRSTSFIFDKYFDQNKIFYYFERLLLSIINENEDGKL